MPKSLATDKVEDAGLYCISLQLICERNLKSGYTFDLTKYQCSRCYAASKDLSKWLFNDFKRMETVERTCFDRPVISFLITCLEPYLFRNASEEGSAVRLFPRKPREAPPWEVRVSEAGAARLSRIRISQSRGKYYSLHKASRGLSEELEGFLPAVAQGQCLDLLPRLRAAEVRWMICQNGLLKRECRQVWTALPSHGSCGHVLLSSLGRPRAWHGVERGHPFQPPRGSCGKVRGTAAPLCL